MSEHEEWRPVVGFHGYDVSSLGRVRSWLSRNGRGGLRTTPRLLDHGTIRGYPVVCLQGGKRGQHSMFVHQLVLTAFVGPCPEGMECCHFPDRCRTNNRLSNLRWGTPLDNAHDRILHGTNACGDAHGSVTKPDRIPRGSRSGAHTKPWTRRRGELNGNAVLTEDRAKAIIARCEAGDKPGAIAKALGLSRGCVEMVFYGYSWRHLPRAVDPLPMRGLRHTRGAANGRAVLSEETARAIIALLHGGARPVDIARKHHESGATESRVREIKSGRAWIHLPRPW